MTCRYCGENVQDDDLLHLSHCDGRQGAVEATELRARGSDPATSHAAMAAYDKDRMANAIAFVVDLYRRHGAMADFHLKDRFEAEWKEPCSPHLYRQARSSARDKGLIHDTGAVVRNPESGRQQIVWAYCREPAPVIHRCPTCGKVTRRTTRGGAR